MARTVADQPTTSRAARAKLPARKAPYWRATPEPQIALGYFKGKAGAGTWFARITKPDGRQQQVRLGVADDLTTADGSEVLDYRQAEAKARAVIKPTTGGDIVTVADATRAWAKEKAAHASSPTAAHNLKLTGERLAVAFDKVKIATLTERRITAWRDDFIAALDLDALDEDQREDALRRRRATWNREVAALKAALTLAAGAGPWQKVAKFRETFGKRVGVLTPAEAARLIASAPDPATGVLIELAYETGARFGELATVRCDRVTDAGERTTMTVTGKTGTRTVVLSARAATIVRNILSGVNDRTRHLLLRADGKPWAAGDQRLPVQRAYKAAGLSDGSAVLYTLRHTRISAWLAAGVPVRAVAEQAGTSLAMIEATYAQFTGDQKARWFA